MTNKTTRTINPLHFGDLEPKRFEDLVRQIFYDFRSWERIEATGRSGSDDGFDIRATERVQTDDEEMVETEDGPVVLNASNERLWLIQCKREEKIGPAKMKRYCSDITSNKGLHGVIFVASADLSKKTRDTFFEEMRSAGVNEFHILSRAELEDLLFQPKYDHLLFAYFGISLSHKSRSKKTEVRSKLSIKRQLVKVVGEVDKDAFQEVLLRDVFDEKYPYSSDVNNFGSNPSWQVVRCLGHYHSGIIIEEKKFFAFCNEKGEWDYAEGLNDIQEFLPHNPWNKKSKQEKARRERVWGYWYQIPEKNRFRLIVQRFIPYDRVYAVDSIGDHAAPIPHIYVRYEHGSAFEPDIYRELLEPSNRWTQWYAPDDDKRIEYFPKKFPKFDRHKYFTELAEKEVQKRGE